MDDFTHADPAALQGQLQRGRGLGARRVLTESGAAELVYECVITDSREDWQTEERDSYLARLIHRLDLSLVPIEQHLFSHNGDDAQEITLALQVLALLPAAGRVDAVALLRRYALEGRHWASALETVEWTASQMSQGIWAGFVEDVIAGHDDSGLAAHIDEYGAWEPWTSWAHSQPRLRRILDDHTARNPRPPRQPASLDTCRDVSAAKLVRRVIADRGRDQRLALRELGRRGDLVVLDLAETTSLRLPAGFTPGMSHALRHLGTAAVARARTWVGSGDRTLQHLAVEVLSGFGTRDDVPYLLNRLADAASAGDWCATEAPARGLGRLRVAEAIEALVHVWEATVHSRARDSIFEGMRGCAPDRIDGYTVEGLDDCEPLVQQAACAIAPDIARARLEELREDPFAPESREAARLRLTQLADSPSARRCGQGSRTGERNDRRQ